jgi:hypothetical protein
VAVGGSGAIQTSSDGVTWTAQTSGTSASFSGISWSGSHFAAVGSGAAILTSPDGVIWTEQISAATAGVG